MWGRLVLLTALALTLLPASALAAPGPVLTEPTAALTASVSCGTGSPHQPEVLLVHGALGDGGEWTGNYALLLPKLGFDVCAVTVPGRDEGDLSRAVQYVVHAIRAVHARAARPVIVIAHSAGAFLTTVALKYWPDLGADVKTFVGLSGVYGNGTESIVSLCKVTCPDAARQIEPGSRFLSVYSRRPLYRGPSYTTINTADDELVFPQPAAGELAGATNITLQDVCPGRIVDHVGIVLDAEAYALVLDAIQHPGPADPARVDRSVCALEMTPGIDLGPFVAEAAGAVIPIVPPFINVGQPEPPLPCFMDPACPKARLRPRLIVRSMIRRNRAIVVTGTLALPPDALDQCAGQVIVRAFGGRRRVVRRSARVGVIDCVWRVRLRLGSRAQTLRLTVSYAGDRELTAATATTRST